MSKIHIEPECQDRQKPIYAHLEPIASALLASGNELARAERWGSNKEGFVCYLTNPIDFALVRENFELPESVVLSEKNDLIGCNLTWATIYGSQAKWGAR